jgi:PAP2 superfamily
MQQGVSLAPQVEERRGVVKGFADFRSAFIAGFQTHLIPYILALSILVSGYAAVEFGGGSDITPSFQAFAAKYLAMAATYVLLFLLLIKFLRMVFVERPEKPLSHLAQWGFSNLSDVRRLANGIHGSLFIFMLMSGFTMWKNQVAVLGHFAWDQKLASFDLFMHGGLLPQDGLALVFGFPQAAKIIDMAYLMWFPMLFGSTFIMSFQPRQTFLRLRFMIALAFAWALGGIITANIFSSAGPVYYGRLNPSPDLYAGHMELIRSLSASAHLEALVLQDSLWAAYAATPSFSSISAFPSMHVAISMLVFLACRHLGWWLKFLSAVYLGFIFLGSIFLGWHYAIDGYAGAGIALVAWWLGGVIARKYEAEQTSS